MNPSKQTPQAFELPLRLELEDATLIPEGSFPNLFLFGEDGRAWCIWPNPDEDELVLAHYIVTACNAYPSLTQEVQELREKLERKIQERDSLLGWLESSKNR